MNQKRKISKSLMMACRKECLYPVKCRYILGLKSTNPLKDKGTEVHDIIKNYWMTGELTECKPYTENFKRIIFQLKEFGIEVKPTRVEFFIEDERCKGQVDFELNLGGELCIGEIKTSKPPSSSKQSDLRLEMSFYARITGAKWMCAMSLGGSGGLLFEVIKPALLKRVEKEITATEELMKSGVFVRKQGKLCIYCDESIKSLCGMEVIAEGMK